MKRSIVLFGIILQVMTLSAQGYFERFQELCGGSDLDYETMFELLQEWEAVSPEDVDLSISYFNYYFTIAREEAMGFTREVKEDELALALKSEENQKEIFLTSQVFYKSEDLEKAFQWVDNAILLAPERLDFRFAKCHALGKAKKWQEMANSIKVLLKASYASNHKWAWQEKQNIPDAERAILDAIQNYNMMIYDTEDDDLLSYMRTNSLHVLEHKPDHTVSLSNVAITYMLVGDHENAITFLEKALKLDPEDPILVANLAQVYYRAKNFEESKKHYQELLRIGDDDFKQQANYFLEQMN